MTITIPCYPSISAFIKAQHKIEKENSMGLQKEMGHFINWRFGVPVRVYERNLGGYNHPEHEEGRLVNESSNQFTIIFNDRTIGHRSKQNFHYELIPHQAGVCEPRYLVCQSDKSTAYCNADSSGMSRLNTYCKFDLIPVSQATLNIDGKTIELSAETTAELKKKLEL